MITTENFWFWFGGIWLAVGVVLLVVGGGVAIGRAMTNARLEAEGVSSEGLVLTKQARSRDDGAETHAVTFRFTPAGGDAVVGSANLDPRAWDALTERGPIAVRYLADRPQTYRVAGERSSAAIVAFVLPLIGAVVAGIGGFVLVNARRGRRIASAA